MTRQNNNTMKTHLGILALVGLFTTPTLADSMAVYSGCGFNYGGGCDSSQAVFYTDYGGFRIDANDGCRATGVPGMVDFCVDWKASRAHFRFSHQSFKRCLGVTGILRNVGCSDWNDCTLITWKEIACSWRETPKEPEATVSAAVGNNTLPTPTASPSRVEDIEEGDPRMYLGDDGGAVVEARGLGIGRKVKQ